MTPAAALVDAGPAVVAPRKPLLRYTARNGSTVIVDDLDGVPADRRHTMRGH